MAQAFSDRGEGIVLRSEPFTTDPAHQSKTPHLPRELAAELMRRVISSYEGVHHQAPRCIVVYKWQRYDAEERAGFIEAIEETNAVYSHDRVAFGNRGIRFFRAGEEPPL